MVDAVVGFLLENLKRIVSQELELLSGVEDEVRLLEDELKSIHLYLKKFGDNNNNNNNNNNSISPEYVKQIRELVHKAEDVIDTYVTNNLQQQRGKFWENVTGFFKATPWRRKHAAAEQIKSIRERLRRKYEERREFDDSGGGQGNNNKEMWGTEHALSHRRRDPSEEIDMVGFKKEIEEITKMVTDESARLKVITIVGMSGLGKTTLASRIYNDPNIRDHFQIHAWMSVSQSYNLRQLMERIIQDLINISSEEVEKMSSSKLSSMIQEQLSCSRFLLVLDDVWKPEFWYDVSRFFTGNRYGSRIIITTRNIGVSSSIQFSSPFHLRLLSDGESWDLLSKRVFDEWESSGQLVGLGKKIAEKCRGLPLAILVVAGVLKRQKTTDWWSQVLCGLNEVLNDWKQQCLKILELSYKNLPIHLRQCFLYFGLFPEDHEIRVRLLTCLWIAEGFVSKKDMRTEEQVAEEYLNELIARNLVQVKKRRTDGTVKSCRVHDLLRAFCIEKAEDEQYLEIHGFADSSSMCSARRLALYSNALHYIDSNRSSSSLRSLLVFGRSDDHVESKHWRYLCQGYMLLRVLEFGGLVVDKIPSEIELLICLRYLRFKSNTIQTLPASIGNLWNLQTLEILAPLVERPEINIWKMRQLRHLYFNGDILLPQPPKRTVKDRHDFHSNLQTLCSINPESFTEVILGELPNLIRLGIFGDLRKLHDKMFTNLPKLDHLVRLKLKRDLRYGSLTQLPSIELIANIKTLTLSQLELEKDPMKQLQKLRKLQVLKLKYDAYVGKVLDCTEVDFPQLQVLKLVSLSLKRWDASAESMPSLTSVVISYCENLADLPSSLAYIRNLQELKLSWSSTYAAKCAAEIKTIKEEKKQQFRLVVGNHTDVDVNNLQ